MIRCLAIFILFACLRADGATWYVDCDNVSGTTNGTSWATAWKQPRDVVWASVSPGDTVEISDCVYANGFDTTGLAWAADNPVFIKKSKAVGHTGVALIVGDLIMGFANESWIEIDGSLDAAFVAPTNYYQAKYGATAITNNIGIISSNAAVGFYNNMPFSGVKIRWCGVKSATNHPSGPGESHAFSFPISTAGRLTNNLIQYCAVSITWADGVQWTGGSLADGPDERMIDLCLFEHIGDDGVEGNHGVTLRRSVLGPFAQRSGHADGIQTAGDYWTVRENWFRDGGLNSSMRVTIGYGDSSPLERNTQPKIFNNLLTFGEFTGTDPNGGTYVYPTYAVEIVNYNPQNRGTNYVWDGAVIAGNTVYGFTGPSPVFDWVYDYVDEDGGPLYVTNWFITNSIIAGNLIVECNKGLGGASWDSDSAIPPYGSHYRPQDLRLDWNIATATNGSLSTPKGITYRGSDYSDGAAMAAVEEWNNNGTNYPRFVDVAAKNFDLAVGDTAAFKRGTNLTSYGITNDIMGRARSASEQHTIGAWEPPDYIAFWSFDNDTHGGTITDDSGNGRTGYRFNLTEYSYPSNRTAATAAGTTFRPNVTGQCLDNLWRTNNGVYNPMYLDDGSFVAVTNLHNVITNISEFSWCFWARYYPVTRTDKIGADYSSDANAAILSFGSTAGGTKGSSAIRRYNIRQWEANSRWVIQTNEGFAGGSSWGDVGNWAIGYGSGNQVFFEYPDRGYESGNTTNWYFYAGSWSNGTVRTYFSTSPTTISMLTNLTLGTMTTLRLGSGGRPYDPILIGASPHTGTHQFDGDAYPNDAWFNGVVDNIRLFPFVVTLQGFINVANLDGGDFDDAPEEGGGGGIPPSPAVGRTGKIMGIRLR